MDRVGLDLGLSVPPPGASYGELFTELAGCVTCKSASQALRVSDHVLCSRVACIEARSNWLAVEVEVFAHCDSFTSSDTMPNMLFNPKYKPGQINSKICCIFVEDLAAECPLQIADCWSEGPTCLCGIGE